MLAAIATILVVSCLGLAIFPSQSDFPLILPFVGVAFASYALLVFKIKVKWSTVLWTGMTARVGLFFIFPNLSDDIYRFLWDGLLTNLGYNPYGYLPIEMLGDTTPRYMQILYDRMNSPEYYTIYPPVAQLIFYLSSWSAGDLLVSTMMIKGVFLSAEILTVIGIGKVLKYLNQDRRLAGIYFLNPLVIIEGMGNLHFEILMVCFLIWSIYFVFIKKRVGLGAFFYAFSIASKLMPLMFLPFFFFQWKGRERISFFAAGVLFTSILFLPIGLGLDFANFGASIDLYFQKFEFNASVYYTLRWIGELWRGYNMIHVLGPALGLTTLGLILWRSIKMKSSSLKSFLEFSIFAFCTYLLLATTVHPWYLITPVFLSVFLRWRFTILWSFLIMLTYINYSYGEYWENLWVVAVEYLLVIGFLWYEYRLYGHWKNFR